MSRMNAHPSDIHEGGGTAPPACTHSAYRGTPLACVALGDERPGQANQGAIPGQAARREGSSTNSATWSDYATAASLAGQADGVGFALHDSEYAAFDCDDCRNPETGAIEPGPWT